MAASVSRNSRNSNAGDPHVQHPGVVHEDVDPAEPTDYRVHHRFGLVAIRQVRDERSRVDAAGREFVTPLVDPIAGRRHRDRGALAPERARARGTDAGRAPRAGDQRHPACRLLQHDVSPDAGEAITPPRAPASSPP